MRLTPHIKDQIITLLTSFKTLMETLVAEQKHNEELVQERTKKNEEQLRLVRTGKNLGKVYSAYGNATPHSKFMDKRK